tara:strand:- start:64 stop:225 length:162 start_codon:yes stop_codon:yes gene_type:complete
MKKLIQMFRDTLMINGINTIIVAMIAINVFIKVALKNKKAITKAATAKATPTP